MRLTIYKFMLFLFVLLSGLYAGPAISLRLSEKMSGRADADYDKGPKEIKSTVNPEIEQITFSEVMFDPIGDENTDEFIEIYNHSESAVSLSGWTLVIDGSIDSITALYGSSDSIVLPPRHFALIHNAKYWTSEQVYEDLIPDTVLRLNVSDGRFGQYGLSNSSARTLELKDSEEQVISFYTYSPNNAEGHTDEKIILHGPNSESNWGNSTILHGTPGFRNSVTPFDYDLSFAHGPVWSPNPAVPDSFITIYITVINSGLLMSDDGSLRISHDVNRDSSVSETEVIMSLELPSISSGDSIILPADINMTSGVKPMIAELVYDADQDTTDNTLYWYLPVRYPAGTLLINEIMYDPFGGLPEWIEIYNSSMEIVDLHGWRFGDASSKVAEIENSVSIFPDCYLVLAKVSDLGNYDYSESSVVVPGIFPMLNNSEDGLYLRDAAGALIDTVQYYAKWGGGDGISLERMNPKLGSMNASNWIGAKMAIKATPTNRNSQIVDSLSVLFSHPEIVPITADPDQPISISGSIVNLGLVDVTLTSVSLYDDVNYDSILATDELLQSETYDRPINVGDSLFASVSALTSRPGQRRYVMTATFDEFDSVTTLMDTTVMVTYYSAALVVNEIMYAPDEEPEWIEVYNLSDKPVNMLGWKIGDASGVSEPVNGIMAIVPPRDFRILTGNAILAQYYDQLSDESIFHLGKFPTLNNSGDKIRLITPAGNIQDSVAFFSQWGGKEGKSLERKNPFTDSNDPSNWGDCVAADGATPGARNSVLILDVDPALDSVFVLPDYQDACEGEQLGFGFVVTNRGLQNITDIATRLQLLGRSATGGSEIRFDTTIISSVSLQTYQSYSDTFRISSISGGIHYMSAIIVSDHDQNPHNNADSCTVKVGYRPESVAINEIMYAPESGEAEWFEIYNRTQNWIDLRNWTFRDASGSRKSLLEELIFIPPRGFAVVAGNLDFRLYYPGFNQILIVPENFPTLNNSSDSLFLFDAVGRQIERIYYRSEWGGSEGISVERRDPFTPALDESNWRSSTDSIGATPGIANSVLKYHYDLAIVPESFRFVERTTELLESVAFNVAVENIGSLLSNRFSLEIFHDRNQNGSASVDELVWSLHSVPPLTPDSTVTLDGEIFSEQSGRNRYIAMIAMESDQNGEDNLAITDLLVAFPRRALVLNEFLPAPVGEQTEFIELFNLIERPVDLVDWIIGTGVRQSSLLPSVTIDPGNYLVLAQDSGFFNYFPPTEAPVIIPGKWPGINNTAGVLVIKDLTGKQIDSLFYDASWNFQAGKSLEKKLPQLPSVASNSWMSSTATAGGTPGILNSVTPCERDISLQQLLLPVETGDTDDQFEIGIIVKNAGVYASEPTSIAIVDSYSGSDTIGICPLTELEQNKIDTFYTKVGPFSSGKHPLKAILRWERDQDHQNDTLRFEIGISFQRGDLLLSEFMAYPFDIRTAHNSVAEFIEIYNPGDQPIPLDKWQVCDENTASPARIRWPYAIPPDNFFVVASDSSVFNYMGVSASNTVVLPDFPSLNNDADQILMLDLTGVVIDSLSYTSDWPLEKNTSMERIFYTNPNTVNNWRMSAAADGATPGLPNSVAVTPGEKKFGLKATPNPFSPDGDGVDDEVALHYQIPFPSAKVTLEIYDLMGRLIYQPAKNLFSSSEGVVYWSGASQYAAKARIGMYIARCTATDIASRKTVGYITTVVLAR